MRPNRLPANVRPPGDVQCELFRRPALAALADDGGGAVMAIAQPASSIALLLAAAVVALLATALYIVEVPRRAPAVGVLMPPDGMHDVTAPAAAMVTGIAVEEGESVAAGQLLLQLVARRTGASGALLASSQRASLQRELGLLRRIAEGQDELRDSRRQALVRRIDAQSEERAIAARDAEELRRATALAERRLERARPLQEKGLVAASAIDEFESLLLEARRRQRDGDSRRVRLDAEVHALSAQAEELDTAARVDAMQYAADGERLQRQLQSSAVEEAERIAAPFDARVIRIGVSDGSFVAPGQALVTLVRPGQPLQAWLYVASRDVGRTRPGQAVQLRMDGWPQQVFGTPRARITSISGSALWPRDLAVPLALPGPVFEIRARLDSQTLHGMSGQWALRPGASFRADVIKERYRLYQWLGRSLGTLLDDDPV